MGETTLSTASKCPKCNNTGEIVKQSPTRDPRITGYVYKCTHSLCLWYNTTWLVTADDDGKVQEAKIGTERLFPKRDDITPAQLKRLRETFDDEV